MDVQRNGTVDREAIIRRCRMCNIGDSSVGMLIEAFDRSGQHTWDFNEFVSALKRTDYSESHEGVAAIGAHEYAARDARAHASGASGGTLNRMNTASSSSRPRPAVLPVGWCLPLQTAQSHRASQGRHLRRLK